MGMNLRAKAFATACVLFFSGFIGGSAEAEELNKNDTLDYSCACSRWSREHLNYDEAFGTRDSKFAMADTVARMRGGSDHDMGIFFVSEFSYWPTKILEKDRHGADLISTTWKISSSGTDAAGWGTTEAEVSQYVIKCVYLNVPRGVVPETPDMVIWLGSEWGRPYGSCAAYYKRKGLDGRFSDYPSWGALNMSAPSGLRQICDENSKNMAQLFE